MKLKAFVARAKRIFEIPFDSTRKMMTVIMKANGKESCYMKGAPERVYRKMFFCIRKW